MNSSHFDKWEYLNGVEQDSFLGEPLQREFEQFRRCYVCGIVQEFNWDSQGGGWSKLSPGKTAIFNKKYPIKVF